MALQVLCVFLFVSAVLSLDPRWKLLWSDDFNGAKLDTNKWSARKMKGLNAGELQYYLEDYVSVANGKLVITTAVNPKNTTETQGITANYLSGWIDSVGKFSTTYGRYEIYGKLPYGSGLWPAYWTLSDYLCWPRGAEFDIMEFRGYRNNSVWGTYHFSPDCTNDRLLHNGSYYDSKFDLSQGYHTHAIEWFPGNVTWFLDDVPYITIYNTTMNKGQPWDMDVSPHYMIINTAVGDFAGPVYPNTTFPQYHYVDYVKVYSWEPCSKGCGHGCCDTVSATCKCDGGYKGSNCEYSSLPIDATGRYNADFTKGTLRNNATVKNGMLVLTADTTGCPNGEGACVIPSWSPEGIFDKGNFTFVMKNSNVTGYAFNLFAKYTASSGFYEYWQVNFICAFPKKFGGSTNSGSSSISVGVNTTFDMSQDFHTYSLIWAPNTFTIYVDGVFANVLNAPTVTSPTQLTVQLVGNSISYTKIDPTKVPTSAYVKSFTWTPLQPKANCQSTTTSASSASAATSAPSTTSAPAATAASSSASATSSSPSSTSTPSSSTSSPSSSTSSPSSSSSSPSTSTSASPSSTSATGQADNAGASLWHTGYASFLVLVIVLTVML